MSQTSIKMWQTSEKRVTNLWKKWHIYEKVSQTTVKMSLTNVKRW